MIFSSMMIRKNKVPIKKGYFYAVVASLSIGLLNGLKYTIVLKETVSGRDWNNALISVSTVFVLVLVPSLFAARLYYKVKEGSDEQK